MGLLDRAWPNLLRKWKGLPVDLNLINGVWCGHFGRDHYKAFPHIPELFLYSVSLIYLLGSSELLCPGSLCTDAVYPPDPKNAGERTSRSLPKTLTRKRIASKQCPG